MRWKLCIVATTANAGHLQECVRNLLLLGLDDGIHVVCGHGVSVPGLDCIARTRFPKPLTESQTWVAALEEISRQYSSSTDLFMFVDPEIRWWPEMRTYCEATVEQEFVAAYMPYTPERLYSEDVSCGLPRACQQGEWGWCQVDMRQPLRTCKAMILNRRSARLAAVYLRDTIQQLPEESRNQEWSWPDLVSSCFGRRYGVIGYAATPSLGRSVKEEAVQSVEDLQRLQVRDNMYLN